jgi:hypothetical protein
VVAHLIGWNRYTILGCEQLRQSLEPFYYADAATDYKTVNAASVRKYRSRVRSKLLIELETSLMELRAYLESLHAKEWDTDFGIRRRGTPITIRNRVNALTRDYTNHRKQIEAWAKALRPSRGRVKAGGPAFREREGSRLLRRKRAKTGQLEPSSGNSSVRWAP